MKIFIDNIDTLSKKLQFKMRIYKNISVCILFLLFEKPKLLSKYLYLFVEVTTWPNLFLFIKLSNFILFKKIKQPFCHATINKFNLRSTFVQHIFHTLEL